MTTTFLMNVNSIAGDFEYYYNQVNQTRKDKIDKLLFMPDKLLSLTAGILLKNALEHYGLKYDEIQFSYNKYGKPFANDNLFFNLSHSGEYSICSVSQGQVGCDIQLVEPIKQQVIDISCTDAEIEYLSQFQGNVKNTEFCKLWAKKESYVKYLGIGIQKKIDTFNIKDAYFMEYILKDYAICVCSSKNEFDDTLQIF